MNHVGILGFYLGMILAIGLPATGFGNLAAYGITKKVGSFNSITGEIATTVDLEQLNTPLYSTFLEPDSPVFMTGFLEYYFTVSSPSTSLFSDASEQEQTAYLLVQDGLNQMIVVGQKDGAIQLFDANTGVLVDSFVTVGSKWIYCLAMFQDHGERFLVSGDAGNRINVYNYDTRLLVQSIEAFAKSDASPLPPWVVDMVVFKDGETIKIVANGFAHETDNMGAVASFNPLTGEKYYEKICADRVDSNEPNSGQTYGMVLYKQGDAAELAIAVYDPDYILKIYDPVTGEVIRKLQDPRINDAKARPSEIRAFKYQGKIKLAVGYFHGEVGIWDSITGNLEYFATVLDRQVVRGISIFHDKSEPYGVIAGGLGPVQTWKLFPLQFYEELDVNPDRSLVSSAAHQQELISNPNEFAASHFNITLGVYVPHIKLNDERIVSVQGASSK